MRVRRVALGAGVEFALPENTVIHVLTADRPPQPMSSYLLAILCVLNGCLGESGFLRDELSLMNGQLLKLGSITSHLAWTESRQPNIGKKLRLVEVHTEWRNSWCGKLLENYNIDIFGSDDEYRQFYLLCRGPRFELEQARELAETLHALRSLYRRKICRKDGTCLSGEKDLERLMKTSRDPEELLWAWIEWRNEAGEASRNLYTKLVKLLNAGARNNGYNDIGECWREEFEMSNPERLAEKIYSETKSLYAALHAVVRFKLNRYYGNDLVSLNEAIPSDLLGSLWGERWGNLIDLIVDVPKTYNITERLKRRNYTVTDLVKRSEDFYLSLGFRPMTEEFWKNSKFVKVGDDDPVCHGSAANMFHGNDFRMLMCAEVTSEDLQVISHEMGHIQYFMQYQHQPAIFQEGADPAFQEAIGGAISYGLMAANHLQRLGVISEMDGSSGIELRLLLEQALHKLTQIPFALALEKWRWGVFRGDITPENYNKAWWFLMEKFQGVKPPVPRSEEFFDPGAVFHINDNAPYISIVLEAQMFESLCNGTFFGYENMNKTQPILLHRCDIYGSKDGAEKLRNVMSFGRRIRRAEALKIITGETSYSTRSLLNYYRPLYNWLIKEIIKYRIPVGW